MDNKLMRVALYARVSTTDKGQDTDLQLVPLREYCKARGWDIQGEYVDSGISGAKDRRPQLDSLMNDARKRKIDCIIVWKLDRWGRSMKHLVTSLNELQSLGITFVSYMENIDLSTAQGQLMANILSSMSQFERALIQERVKAGMALAKLKGVRIGRKPTPPQAISSIINTYESNTKLSVREIAEIVNVPRSTVHRSLKQYKAGEIGRDGILLKAA